MANTFYIELDDNEDWDNWKGEYEEDEGPHCNDPNFNVSTCTKHVSLT